VLITCAVHVMIVTTVLMCVMLCSQLAVARQLECLAVLIMNQIGNIMLLWAQAETVTKTGHNSHTVQP